MDDERQTDLSLFDFLQFNDFESTVMSLTTVHHCADLSAETNHMGMHYKVSYSLSVAAFDSQADSIVIISALSSLSDLCSVSPLVMTFIMSPSVPKQRKRTKGQMKLKLNSPQNQCLTEWKHRSLKKCSLFTTSIVCGQ